MEKKEKPETKARSSKPETKTRSSKLYGRARNVRSRLRAGILFNSLRWTEIPANADVKALRADPCVQLEER